jgi:hypothetical protein
MDKDKAFTEIRHILGAKENEHKDWNWQQEEIKKVLEELQTYQYNWGVRQGIFKSINNLTDLIENENK